MGTSLQIAPVTPEHRGFARLATQARVEGYRFIDRLEAEWRSKSNRFEASGECLLGIVEGEDLLAIGGLNIDPYVADGSTGRLRHVYVCIERRNQGLGRLLVGALVAAARPCFGRIRLRTDNPLAARLYERMGFLAADAADATHIVVL